MLGSSVVRMHLKILDEMPGIGEIHMNGVSKMHGVGVVERLVGSVIKLLVSSELNIVQNCKVVRRRPCTSHFMLVLDIHPIPRLMMADRTSGGDCIQISGKYA